MEKREKIRAKLMEHMKAVVEKYPDYRVMYIGLFGSQNYGLDTEESDVDTKCIIIPPKRDLFLKKDWVSSEIHLEDGSICMVKDVRAMFREFYKGNINFVEILFTDYYLYDFVFDPFITRLCEYREDIALRNTSTLLNMCLGMMKQKRSQMSHPFAGKEEVLAKYGYDPKQLLHIARLARFCGDIVHECKSFSDALRPDEYYARALLDLKVDPLSLNDAVETANYYIAYVEDLIHQYSEFLLRSGTSEYAQEIKDRLVKDFLEDLAYEIIDYSLSLPSKLPSMMRG